MKGPSFTSNCLSAAASKEGDAGSVQGHEIIHRYQFWFCWVAVVKNKGATLLMKVLQQI